jgi:hypothetical protein
MINSHDPDLVKKIAIVLSLVAVFIIVLICTIVYLKFTGRLPTLFRKERKSDVEMADSAETAATGDNNTSFVASHLAMLRAWTGNKPAALDKGKASTEPTKQRVKKTYSTKGRDAAAAYYSRTLNNKGKMPTIAEEPLAGPPAGANVRGEQARWEDRPLQHYTPN